MKKKLMIISVCASSFLLACGANNSDTRPLDSSNIEADSAQMPIGDTIDSTAVRIDTGVKAASQSVSEAGVVVGQKAKHTGEAVEGAAEDSRTGIQKAVDGTKKVAVDVGQGVKKGAQVVGKAAKDGANAVKDVVDGKEK